MRSTSKSHHRQNSYHHHEHDHNTHHASGLQRVGDVTLGLMRLVTEGLVYLLLLGGMLTYGWAADTEREVAILLMLAGCLYPIGLVALGHWNTSQLPAPWLWFCAALVMSGWALIQVWPTAAWATPAMPGAPLGDPRVGESLAAAGISVASAGWMMADPAVGISAAIELAAWWGLALGIWHMASRQNTAARLITALAVVGVIQGLLGAGAFGAGTGNHATGSLYNRNHYGMMMAMLLPIMLGAIRLARHSDDRFNKPLLSGENPLALGYVAVAVAAVGMMASASRAAFLFGGLVLLGYVLHEAWVDAYVERHSKLPEDRPKNRGGELDSAALRQRAAAAEDARVNDHDDDPDRKSIDDRPWYYGTIFTPRRLAPAAVLLVLLLGLLSMVDSRGVQGSLDTSRLDHWRVALDVIHDHPTGIGPGSTWRFLNIYESRHLRQEEAIHVHCDWLQYPMEAGLPAAIIVGILLLAAAAQTTRTWYLADLPINGRRALVRRAAGWSMLACLLGALTDFHLRIPMVAVIFAIVSGLWVSYGWREIKSTIKQSAAAGRMAQY